jgi:hypothetical protein
VGEGKQAERRVVRRRGEGGGRTSAGCTSCRGTAWREQGRWGGAGGSVRKEDGPRTTSWFEKTDLDRVRREPARVWGGGGGGEGEGEVRGDDARQPRTARAFASPIVPRAHLLKLLCLRILPTSSLSSAVDILGRPTADSQMSAERECRRSASECRRLRRVSMVRARPRLSLVRRPPQRLPVRGATRAQGWVRVMMTSSDGWKVGKCVGVFPSLHHDLRVHTHSHPSSLPVPLLLTSPSWQRSG